MKEKLNIIYFKIIVLLFLFFLLCSLDSNSLVKSEALNPGYHQNSPDPTRFTDVEPFKQGAPLHADSRLTSSDNVIEVFTNGWSYSSTGLVFDPLRNTVRYAHESQSNTSNPTIYEVDQAPPHSVGTSFALSAVNSGWPWQVDNRTGVGYNFTNDTYFLPDYNGDLSYADDNIVEIDSSGNILNAWEMDDEVGSNDSSDGSEIDSIIDIAVVPGTPPRYFVTAAYDGAVVYEISLIKTGTLWTPNSWSTVATYTLPEFTDNLGIDWDAEHEVLFHSDWHSTTILITDLAMNPISGVEAAFNCPGAGGYNSGVTYIEGSDPPEIWVTDFSSDQTTRCNTPFDPPDWEKSIDELPWQPDISLSKETGDTLLVEDIITPPLGNLNGFALLEEWNPDELELVDFTISPPEYGQYVSSPSPGTWFFEVPIGVDFGAVTITKWFLVQTCNWSETTLMENLFYGQEVISKPFAVIKNQPLLGINSFFDVNINSGDIAEFILTYENAGGFESQAYILTEFPPGSAFFGSDPAPTEIGTTGQWAKWDLGSLAFGDAGSIVVGVQIDPDLPPFTTLRIEAGIIDHVNLLEDETAIFFRTMQALYLPLVICN